jgi:hypothetical protein
VILLFESVAISDFQSVISKRLATALFKCPRMIRPSTEITNFIVDLFLGTVKPYIFKEEFILFANRIH